MLKYGKLGEASIFINEVLETEIANFIMEVTDDADYKIKEADLVHFMILAKSLPSEERAFFEKFLTDLMG